ncbi:hypothetical protein HPB50_012329 [Hyalomma asiaticum]|uniref:Uncharacterized protein n=1 Tax=Hyalomma asiaticum TaxID=266040 RepID=A0ACB7TJC9_HYAAI|nr:hypothetical protein HPB50_012329 [Hyalomma asiaticum]
MCPTRTDRQHQRCQCDVDASREMPLLRRRKIREDIHSSVVPGQRATEAQRPRRAWLPPMCPTRTDRQHQRSQCDVDASREMPLSRRHSCDESTVQTSPSLPLQCPAMLFPAVYEPTRPAAAARYKMKQSKRQRVSGNFDITERPNKLGLKIEHYHHDPGTLRRSQRPSETAQFGAVHQQSFDLYGLGC